MLFLRALFIAITALLLTACSHSPVVQLYDGPAKPDTQVLTIQVPSELEVFTINGKEVDGVNTFFATDSKQLKLAPGRYEILAYYKELWQLNADNHEVIKSNPANFIVDGKAGEYWELGYAQPEDVEQARALKDDFSGWSLNTASGEKVAAAESGLILKRGFLAPITGEEVSAPASNSVAPQTSSTAATAPVAAATAAASAAPADNSVAPQPSYLDTLKAQWKQATAEERREFLQWISQ